MILKLILGASIAVICTAHVRLTYPPARIYALDFLDNIRTDGPCGMQSNPGSPLTKFYSGQTVNITWHLSYAHRGGHRLELLHSTTGKVIFFLTPENEYLSLDDSTVSVQEVTIPSDATGEYTMRLWRQAAEWNRGAYLFKSCADIEIRSEVPPGECVNQCSGNGVCRSGTCTCDRLASGKFCQNLDDCAGSNDCNGHGACTEVSSHTYPRRQCFCNTEFFGRKCEKANPSDFSMDFTPSEYNVLQLNGNSKDYSLHYRILEDKQEIEVVMDMRGSSWMAIGWRPDSMDATCQSFPVPYRQGGGGDKWVAPASGPDGGPDGELGAEPAGEPTSEPTSEPAAKRRRRTIMNTGIVKAALPQNYNAEWTCSSQGAAGVPGGTIPEPSGEPEPEPEATAEAQPAAPGEAEPAATEEPESPGEPEPSGEPEPETTAEAKPAAPGEARPAAPGEPEPPGTGVRPHAMDCTDIVIGKVLNSTSHIADYYTRDRSTPRLDTFYGGSESITAAGGLQYADRTRFVFRKKLKSLEQTDHSIVKDLPMHVIWAHGQQYCKYVHRPASGFEANTAKDMLFYPRYEIKYHGTSSLNRGQLRGFPLYESQTQGKNGVCGEFKVPSGCTGEACDYKVSYVFNEAADSVTFTVDSKISTGYWGGVAFSSSGSMIGSDAVLSWANPQGVYEVKDMFLGGKASSLVVQDTKQDLKSQEAKYENGWLTMKFTRMLNTGDTDQDVAMDGDKCVFLLMPVSGGRVNGQQLSIHDGVPNLSGKVCLKKCAAVPTTPKGAAPVTTAGLLVVLFAALMTLVNME